MMSGVFGNVTILLSPVACLYSPGACGQGAAAPAPRMSAATPGILTLYMVAPAPRSTHGRGTSATPLARGSAAPGPRSDARRGLPRPAVRPRAGRETGRQRLYCLVERVAA